MFVAYITTTCHVHNFKYLCTCTREHAPCMILSELLLNLTTVLSDSLVVLGFLHYLGSQFLSLLEHSKFCLFDLNCRKSFLCWPPIRKHGRQLWCSCLLHWMNILLVIKGILRCISNSLSWAEDPSGKFSDDHII